MTTTTTTTTNLSAIVDLFRKGLWLPDVGVVYVTLGAVAANRLPGDPVWVLIVGPPSSGKTETLHALSKLDDHHAVDDLSLAGLLSGTVSRDGSGSGGVLRLVGNRGSLVASDFSTLLSGHSEARSAVFSALRRVYDGYFTRTLGTAGGTRFSWEGHCGFLGAVTEAIDSPDVTMGVLGERFSYYRTPAASIEDDLFACSLAAELSGQEGDLRAERAVAVADFMAGLTLPDKLPDLADAAYDRLSTLATIGARLRSPTVRDNRSREIAVVPQSERPMRLLRQLRHLHAGLVVIGCPEPETWRLLAQVALGGTHPGRRAVVDFLLADGRSHSTAAIAGHCRLPSTSTERHLEDLNAHGVLDLVATGPQMWAASDWLRSEWWSVDGPPSARAAHDAGPLPGPAPAEEDF